ncbi:hypothetical protein E3P89_02358 [Wallemia ichthyophaga]|uniref:pH-response transcription factor pacC/RIM101 n=1 Tax=Wallemia ichthyophaga TaxID=245174 RepID=A0A4T0HZ20_WALIC|nr:hypothetical protein E3P90_02888 [Wallemia ichthyophaga]TIB12214.1 hypothetical protein E3P93_02367 [Wallemia ichthyophaga]TIB21930.1 hypothetical protein E3P89_02358 [Wallemia ichthyophaga]TIB23629.1 hypothetical protein E3P88_02449 [Wallemia ichthyophaga]
MSSEQGIFKCGTCGQTFTRRQHESRHQRIHTGEKPYKCTHCPEAFSRSDLLNRHISKQHPSVPIIPKRSANCRPGSRKSMDKHPASKAQRNRDKIVDNNMAAQPMTAESSHNTSNNDEINSFMPTLVETSAPDGNRNTSTDNSMMLFRSLTDNWYNTTNVSPQSPMSIMMASQNQNQNLQSNTDFSTQHEQPFDTSSFNYNDVMSTFLNSPSINIEPNFNTNTLRVSTPTMAIESPFELFERPDSSNVSKDFVAALKRRSSENIQAMSLKIPQSDTFTRLIGGGSLGVSTFKLNTKNMHKKKMSKLSRIDDKARFGSSSSSSSSSSRDVGGDVDPFVKRDNETPTPDYTSSTTLSSPSSASLVTPVDYSKGQAQQAQQALNSIQNLRIVEEKERKSNEDNDLYSSLFSDDLDPLAASSFFETAV